MKCMVKTLYQSLMDDDVVEVTFCASRRKNCFDFMSDDISCTFYPVEFIYKKIFVF